MILTKGVTVALIHPQPMQLFEICLHSTVTWTSHGRNGVPEIILHCSLTTNVIDSFQVCKPQDVMSVEEGTILLSQDIHGYAQQTYAHLHACDNDENLVDAACKYPVKRKIGQNERKHVLED